MSKPDLTHAESHFAFGKNWADYSRKISQVEINEAIHGLQRLFGGESLVGKSVLDIGSGSGLHSLAALRLGAAEVMSVDIDPDSVATTRAVLEKHASSQNWKAELRSVFDLSTADHGKFDVVYSWGVLHHTGDMNRAIRHAAAMCANGGLFAFALYFRIWSDWLWKMEKKWYASASLAAQARARKLHIGMFRGALLASGRDPNVYFSGYRSNRGMDFEHDVHDWMGGWPYESIQPNEVRTLMIELGFSLVRQFNYRDRSFERKLGLFGSGCNEYVYRAPPSATGETG